MRKNWARAALVALGLAGFVVAAAVLSSEDLEASGFITTHKLGDDLRTTDFEFRFIRNSTATDSTVGKHGLLASFTINGGVHTRVQTTSIARPLFPAKLVAWLSDASSDDTLTCQSLLLEGYDQWGRRRTERLTSISETAQYTKWAYERVDRLTLAGCNLGDDVAGDAGDIFILRSAALYPALPKPVASKSDLISVCRLVGTSTSNQAGSGGTLFGLTASEQWDCLTNSEMSSLAAATVDKIAQTLDMTKFTGVGANNVNGPANGDLMRIYYRATTSYQY